MGHRLIVAAYFINQGYNLCKILKFVKIHKTTWYRYKHNNHENKQYTSGRPIPGFSHDKFGNKINDEEILKNIRNIRNDTYTTISGGYKKIKHYLFKDMGVRVNHKKVYRLCKENHFLLPRKIKAKHSRQICINRKVSRPHQVWEFDIKYGYIQGQNRFFYLLVYIDVFSRSIVHYHIGLHCKAKNLAATFSSALRKADIDVNDALVIRSDNGPQMRSKQFYKYLMHDVKHKVEHEFIPCATPNKNAHVESFYSIIESEFIAVHYFNDFQDVYKKFANFLHFYQTRRVHSSLNYRTPDEVLALSKQGYVMDDIKRPLI